MFPLDRKVQPVLHGFKISVIVLKGFHFKEKVLENQLLNKAVHLPYLSPIFICKAQGVEVYRE